MLVNVLIFTFELSKFILSIIFLENDADKVQLSMLSVYSN